MVKDRYPAIALGKAEHLDRERHLVVLGDFLVAPFIETKLSEVRSFVGIEVLLKVCKKVVDPMVWQARGQETESDLPVFRAWHAFDAFPLVQA